MCASRARPVHTLVHTSIYAQVSAITRSVWVPGGRSLRPDLPAVLHRRL